MGVDSLAEITPNAPEFIFPICLPKPKNSGFQWKKVNSFCDKIDKWSDIGYFSFQF